MSDISKKLTSINKRILAACKKANRNPSEVKRLAVSKKFPSTTIEEAANSGQLYFGENYVQEAVEKIEQLSSKLSFDLIGPLQRNKAKIAVGLFDCIQSVDRLELAKEISKQAVKKELIQKILIQVNISGEESKSGVLAKELQALVAEINKLPAISVLGLMAIGKYYDPVSDEELCRDQFVRLRQLRNEITYELGISLPELSMGMSHDFELAIEEGATIVRVGSGIFGERA